MIAASASERLPFSLREPSAIRLAVIAARATQLAARRVKRHHPSPTDGPFHQYNHRLIGAIVVRNSSTNRQGVCVCVMGGVQEEEVIHEIHQLSCELTLTLHSITENGAMKSVVSGGLW